MSEKYERFFIVPNEVIDDPKYNYEKQPYVKYVLMTLCRYRGNCIPSMKHLAKVTGLSLSTVKRAILRLRKDGHIGVLKRRDSEKSVRNANRYDLSELFDRIKKGQCDTFNDKTVHTDTSKSVTENPYKNLYYKKSTPGGWAENKLSIKEIQARIEAAEEGGV